MFFETAGNVEPIIDQLTFYVILARQLKDEYYSRKRKGLPARFHAKKYAMPDGVRFEDSEKNHLTKMISNYGQYRKYGEKIDQEIITHYKSEECDIPSFLLH